MFEINKVSRTGQEYGQLTRVISGTRLLAETLLKLAQDQDPTISAKAFGISTYVLPKLARQCVPWLNGSQVLQPRIEWGRWMGHLQPPIRLAELSDLWVSHRVQSVLAGGSCQLLRNGLSREERQVAIDEENDILFETIRHRHRHFWKE